MMPPGGRGVALKRGGTATSILESVSGIGGGVPVVGWLLLAAAGFVAGVVNTIAGGGSFLTLPLLMEVGGLPASVANGTNRVGIVVQNIAAVFTFRRSGTMDRGLVMRLVGPLALGALLGSWLATRLEDALLRPLFGAILVTWAVVLLFRPGGFAKTPEAPLAPGPRSLVLAFFIGIYAGFIQAGVGFLLMALLISGLGLPPVRTNAVKVTVILLVQAFVALPVFLWAGQVAWREAFVLAAGMSLGGFTGTRWQLKSGAALVRWFVVVTVAVSGVLMILT